MRNRVCACRLEVEVEPAVSQEHWRTFGFTPATQIQLRRSARLSIICLAAGQVVTLWFATRSDGEIVISRSPEGENNEA
jgi:hypothetical protein